MKKKTFYVCFSQIITIFAAVKTIISVFTKVFNYIYSLLKSGLVHSWIIPAIHAALWAAGLYCALEAEDIFSCFNLDNKGIEIIKFLAIFLVLFFEVIIVLLDIYVTQKANYLAPKFILFVILLLMGFIGTTIFAGVAFASKESPICSLLWVLAFSSAVKFIENLLVNNLDWYIIKTPDIFDARGIYISRVLA